MKTRIPLTAQAVQALAPGSSNPETMDGRTSYAISGTEDGHTRVVTRNVTRHDHAATTINALAADGWENIDLYPEAF